MLKDTVQQALRGSITALITPFDENRDVDSAAFSKFVDWQINQGTHGLVPVGTTGESPTITTDEHKHVVDLCIEAADGRVPVIAGAGSNSTREAIAFAQHADKAGADAILVVTPYYNKPSQEGLYQHYTAIHNNCDLPIVIYNIPGRSVVDMTTETMARLYNDLDRVVGVKDATGDLARAADQRAAMGPDFVQLSGEDGTVLGFNALGGQGCISVSSNVAPALCSQFQEAMLADDYKTALSLQDRLLPLHKAMFMEPSPAGPKYAAELLGICRRDVRLPLMSLTSDTQKILDKIVSDLDLPKLG